MSEVEAGRSPYQVIATVTRRAMAGAAIESRVVSLDYQFRSCASASSEAQELHERLRADEGTIAVLTLVMPTQSASEIAWQAVWPEVA